MDEDVQSAITERATRARKTNESVFDLKCRIDLPKNDKPLLGRPVLDSDAEIFAAPTSYDLFVVIDRT